MKIFVIYLRSKTIVRDRYFNIDPQCFVQYNIMTLVQYIKNYYFII